MGNQEAVQAYLNQIASAAEVEDGTTLAALLKIGDDHARQLNGALQAAHGSVVENAVRRRLNEQWAEVVWGHLRVLRALEGSGRSASASSPKRSTSVEDEAGIVRAAELQNTVAQAFHQVFTNQTRWCLPVLYAVDGDLRALSIEADTYLQRTGQKAGRLEDAARSMNKAFSYCVTDRFSPADKSRKWGTYHIVNLLFRIYFRLQQTNLCPTILRSISAGDLPGLERFPIADQLSFKYHVGVLAFYNENYKKADEDLSFALWHCHAQLKKKGASSRLVKNRLLILNYLVPARFILGILPHPTLLTKYPALNYLYGNFVTAIKRGDIKLFDQSLYDLQRDLIDRGTYLTVERARALAVRKLFKKVWILNGSSSRIQMTQFQKALHLAGAEATLDDVGCMLANMIDKGYLKGYVSYEKQMVVTAKEDPFPSIQRLAIS
ncbi:uncharacterized protein EV422DRAFT_567701 [Fimicolochytrium jonesii]|uniref:uncharacterized protein n=1 Tax=Fimicolochytrium jonesii TaxID=1396493 RepID=UPI0022FE9ABE|nr:uncharacterized protein EV422DRAFT_567701 [Fimicolochytrium jonesii]KAI8820809.1 hypothetical protein EV422DRAFT_567701 [Fimicolochytrium jonesii]